MIPGQLLTSAREGDLVLLLGAGASLGATSDAGLHPPKTAELAKLLADRFLGGHHAKEPLAQIGDLAISESSLVEVQRFIRDTFEPFKPSLAHLGMPRFRWWGIATTNYDLLIERAYQSVPDRIQDIRPVIANGDGVDRHQRDSRNVVLAKLHGCMSRIADGDPQLVLTVDQYITHREKRSRVFETFFGWAFEHPMVIIGQSLQDPDLRALLLELDTRGQSRPRYYMVAPNCDEITSRFWESRRITVISCTFADFIRDLDASVPLAARAIDRPMNATDNPIIERFTLRDAAIRALAAKLLEFDYEYVKAIEPSNVIQPEDFYKGESHGWSAIEQELDVRRALADTILAEHVLGDGGEKEKSYIVAIKSHAGSGKSVLLRRLAWDAAREYNALALYARPYGCVEIPSLSQVGRACGERLFIFVDDVGNRVPELLRAFRMLAESPAPITFILAERTNEWNVSCASLDAFVDRTYEIPYLSEKEIDSLLVLLERHKALGRLEDKSVPDRQFELRETAGRQLLVALHEATLGLPFEEIIENEFRAIVPLEAQSVYLTICILNRLAVPVRAGVISRMHDMSFEEFKERFFLPLEHVVFTHFDKASRDNCYRARHPLIADIVFRRCLSDAEERFDKYVRCLQSLNVEYSTDHAAFRRMVRGRALAELFATESMVTRVHEIANQHVRDDAYVNQQMAIYEMNRGVPNLQRADKLLTRATGLAPHDSSIKHSLSELRLKQAEVARTDLHRNSLLDQAQAIAGEIVAEARRSGADPSFAYHTLTKVSVRRVENVLADPEATSDALEDAIKNAERVISDALQRCPGESYILGEESRLAIALSDSDRALDAMRKAFKANARNSYIATRLARSLSRRGRRSEATAILKKALEANVVDRRLHYEYACVLIEENDYNRKDVIYHLERAFSPDDKNYRARFLFATELYLDGRTNDARAQFEILRNSRMSLRSKVRTQRTVVGRYFGSVTDKSYNYLFIRRDDMADDVFFHQSDAPPDVWARLERGIGVEFSLGFSMKGPVATEVRIRK